MGLYRTPLEGQFEAELAGEGDAYCGAGAESRRERPSSVNKNGLTD